MCCTQGIIGTQTTKMKYGIHWIVLEIHNQNSLQYQMRGKPRNFTQRHIFVMMDKILKQLLNRMWFPTHNT